MRRSLTFRAQLAVMAAKHREYAEAYGRCGVVLLSDGTQAMRMAWPERADRHRQCVALLEAQAQRLSKAPNPHPE